MRVQPAPLNRLMHFVFVALCGFISHGTEIMVLQAKTGRYRAVLQVHPRLSDIQSGLFPVMQYTSSLLPSAQRLYDGHFGQVQAALLTAMYSLRSRAGTCHIVSSHCSNASISIPTRTR